MEARAFTKYVPVAPRKVKLVADLVRDRNVQAALDILRFTNKIGAYYIDKALRSALANAGQIPEINVDNLYIKTLLVDNGPIRYWARYRGRLHVSRIRKRWCHITVILDDGSNSENKTPKTKGRR